MLRLQVDDMRMMQLKGAKVDTDEFVRTSERLERVLRTDHRLSETGSPAALEAARDQLRQLITNVVPDFDPDNPPRSELNILREENERLRDSDMTEEDNEIDDAPGDEEEVDDRALITEEKSMGKEFAMLFNLRSASATMA